MCTTYSSNKKPKLTSTLKESSYLCKISPEDFSLLSYVEDITSRITHNLKDWQLAKQHTKQLVMCILAAYDEDSESTSNNFIMFRTEIAPNLFVSYGIGRNQRHLQGENFVDKGAILTKFIRHDSQLGITTLTHCHTVSAFVHENLTVKEMIILGIYIFQFRHHLKKIAQNCQKCRLNSNRMKRKDCAMKESLISTNERFLTCAYDTSMNIVTMDLIGPFIIHCEQETGCTTKFWILATITQADGRVHLTAMNAYSANAFLTAALTLANTIGSFAVITTDAGSQLQPFATSMSEVNQKTNHLNNHWENLISPNKNTLENGGVIFKIVAPGRHQAVSICETIVHRLKEMLGKFNYLKKTGFTTYTEFNLILSHIENTLNSRPLYFFENSMISSNDISTICMKRGMETGSNLINNLDNNENLKAKIARLLDIRKSLNQCLLDHLIPTLMSQQNNNQKHKFGLDARLIEIGDIVLDREPFLKSGNIQGCLGKVEGISKTRKWIIISKVKTSFINRQDYKTQTLQNKFPNHHNLVARRISDCYYITHNKNFDGRKMLALGFKQDILNLNEVYTIVKNNELPLYTFAEPPKHLVNKYIDKVNNSIPKIINDNSEPNITDLIRG